MGSEPVDLFQIHNAVRDQFRSAVDRFDADCVRVRVLQEALGDPAVTAHQRERLVAYCAIARSRDARSAGKRTPAVG